MVPGELREIPMQELQYPSGRKKYIPTDLVKKWRAINDCLFVHNARAATIGEIERHNRRDRLAYLVAWHILNEREDHATPPHC